MSAWLEILAHRPAARRSFSGGSLAKVAGVKLDSMRTWVAAAFAVVAAATLLAQERQEPTFKSSTRIVPVIATVTDTEGRLVPNLDQDQFTILDNGKPQSI